MNIKAIGKHFGLNSKAPVEGVAYYEALRKSFIDQFHSRDSGKFQSPSISPSNPPQRNSSQNEDEFSVYQRSDYTPIKVESDFNKLFPKLNSNNPQTLFFNSGMATISTVMFFLKNVKKRGSLYIGNNVYFETDWLVRDYPDVHFFNEYKPKIGLCADIIWLEYPINCTKPSKFPFDRQLDIKAITDRITHLCKSSPTKTHSLVIDYTLGYLPLDINKWFTRIPNNLEVYLITSLQKHRGFGLDLTNGGALTFYSDKSDYAELVKLRSIMGTTITQETIWLMPKINKNIINKIIKDSGNNAEVIYKEICQYKFRYVKFYFSNNDQFKTSFIFIELDDKLFKRYPSKPYLSDRLINHIIESSKKNSAILVNGTSFGLPFTRIFKNSERYENTNSIRIAVGFDESLMFNVAKSIIEGTNNFLEEVI